MIKLKMKLGSVKTKVKGDEAFFAIEMAFGAAYCINDIVDNAVEFEFIKNEVIRRLEGLCYEDVHCDEE